jgi:hypothetical protein
MIKRISSYTCLVLLAVVVALSLALASAPALGLSVSNAIMQAQVNPGETRTQTMTITIASADAATDVSVEVAGVQQTRDGGYQLLDASHDTSQYSARQFVTVDKAVFHLEPGGSEDITATVTLPLYVGDGGRYAMIHIVTQPAAADGIGTNAAVNVPVYLTVKNSQLIHTGKIAKVATGEIISGQPVNILTSFQNTGNHHFKVRGEVTVTNGQGQTLDIITTPVTSTSILPGVVRELGVSFIPSGDLAAGTYTVGSKVMLEDGTLLGQSSTTFEVTAPHAALPATLVISSVNASSITVSGATITWTTNEAATSQVEYGLTEEWGSGTTLETLVTSHSVELTGLEADTTYHYRVISKDAANNEAVSLDQAFTTARSSGGLPAWAWAIIVLAGVGVAGGAGGAAYFITTRRAKK